MTDPRAMRALAHPLRLELLDQLAVAGTLTAAQASVRVGETPANCSFHLRLLARYGFVEQAEGGRGRERPWRRVPGGIGTPATHDDETTADAARALTDVMVERHLDTVRRYRADVQPGLPPEWLDLSGHTNVITHLTLQEARELHDDMIAVLTRYHDRSTDPSRRPAGSRPVRFFGYLMPLPPDGAQDPA
ncbi:helix-turn-helix domain-containing protein [Dactylosporangium siamense]|uniref:winged helix-turn-helix domain-containing protein n=1 Tax=Dactylosporangium siamense TaxID=685454 RepID=UPI0019432156|nr:helix-turn-helix domain-containing protein [Dactylosporangium siamense]